MHAAITRVDRVEASPRPGAVTHVARMTQGVPSRRCMSSALVMPPMNETGPWRDDWAL